MSNIYGDNMNKVDIGYVKGQVDFRSVLVGLGMIFAGFVVISVMDSVVTGIGLPSALSTTYNDVLDKGGLLLKIGIFGLIMAIVWVLFIRG